MEVDGECPAAGAMLCLRPEFWRRWCCWMTDLDIFGLFWIYLKDLKGFFEETLNAIQLCI